jgi:hypothetical protein
MPDFIPTLSQLITDLTAIVSPPEKRQMLMVSGAFSHLCQMLETGEVAGDVLQKLSQLVSDLSNRNFSGASAIQTDLANTVWSLHKEWIKGLKVLIQLASKK